MWKMPLSDGEAWIFDSTSRSCSSSPGLIFASTVSAFISSSGERSCIGARSSDGSGDCAVLKHFGRAAIEHVHRRLDGTIDERPNDRPDQPRVNRESEFGENGQDDILGILFLLAPRQICEALGLPHGLESQTEQRDHLRPMFT